MHIGIQLREASTALPPTRPLDAGSLRRQREWIEAKRSLTARMRFFSVRFNSRHVIKHQYSSTGLASTAACWEILHP